MSIVMLMPPRRSGVVRTGPHATGGAGIIAPGQRPLDAWESVDVIFHRDWEMVPERPCVIRP
ncbi:hypothetical protein [Stieleria mannarensis]|uniref:hypothetical protein n=1 Tax=Stieleria mannarensis TaxID=2755585 RepID=UPI0015FFE21A|nr:hypothetical protein [Rhodopirellula sp. JC639]